MSISTLLWIGALGILLSVCEPARADEPAPIDLAGKNEIENLAGRASFLFFEPDHDEDGIAPNLSLGEARALAATAKEYTQPQILEERARKYPNAMDNNYLLGPFWARLILTNSGGKVARWRIDARDAYGPTLRAYTTGPDGPQLILDNRWATAPMAQRVPSERLVASRIIEVPAGGTTQVWIDAEYGLSFDEYLRLVSEERFDSDRQTDLAMASLILGARLALFAGLLAFALVLREKAAAYYAGFHAGLVLTTLSQWGFDSFYLGLGEIAGGMALRLTWAFTLTFYALTVSSFLNARRRYPTYARVLFASTFMGLLALPAISIFDLNLHWQWARPFFEVVFFLQFVGVVSFGVFQGLRDTLPGAGWFLFASVMLVFLAIMQGLNAFQALPLANWEVDAFTNALFAFDGALFAAALVIRAIDIRRQRDCAQEAEMKSLADQALLQDRLAEAEIDYQLANAIAEKRRRDLEATSHDLKQPLLSLQMALSKMEGSQDAAEGVSYIERVLRRSGPDADATEPKEHVGFELGIALHNVTTMFRDEAEAQGLELVNVATSERVIAEPVHLMRILANLVSNAIQHSHGTRIIIGAKRNGSALDLIVADNGRGIPEAEIAAIFDRYHKSDESKGDGIGLSTVRDLADEHGWKGMAIRLGTGGTCFRIKGLRLAPD